MGEDKFLSEDAMRRFHERVAEEKAEKDAFNAFLKNLLDGANEHHNTMTSGIDEVDVMERQDCFSDIVHFAVRYAGACAKDHEGSAGMRTKMRSELRVALDRWCKLRREK
jgi:hypothetical protein